MSRFSYVLSSRKMKKNKRTAFVAQKVSSILTSDAGSQYRCGGVGRGVQPPPTHTHFPFLEDHVIIFLEKWIKKRYLGAQNLWNFSENSFFLVSSPGPYVDKDDISQIIFALFCYVLHFCWLLCVHETKLQGCLVR